MLEHKIKVHVKDIMGIILIYIVRRNSFSSDAVHIHVYSVDFILFIRQ